MNELLKTTKDIGELTQPALDFRGEIMRPVLLLRYIIKPLNREASVGEGQRGEAFKEAVAEFQTHFPLVTEMVLCRAVDTYLLYISDLLALIFRTRPETLKSKEEVKLDVILSHQTMAELINSVTEKRVNELAYKGMRELSEYLNERLGLKLFDAANKLEEIIRIIEFRNLIIHNRAVVNHMILSRVPNLPYNLGERIEFNNVGMFEDLSLLIESAMEIDNKAAIKFGLPRVRASQTVHE